MPNFSRCCLVPCVLWVSLASTLFLGDCFSVDGSRGCVWALCEARFAVRGPDFMRRAQSRARARPFPPRRFRPLALWAAAACWRRGPVAGAPRSPPRRSPPPARTPPAAAPGSRRHEARQVPNEAEPRDGDHRAEERDAGARNHHRSGCQYEYSSQSSQNDAEEQRTGTAGDAEYSRE